MIIAMIWRGVVAVWAPAGHGCGIVGQIARAAPGGLITHRSGGKSRIIREKVLMKKSCLCFK